MTKTTNGLALDFIRSFSIALYVKLQYKKYKINGLSTLEKKKPPQRQLNDYLLLTECTSSHIDIATMRALRVVPCASLRARISKAAKYVDYNSLPN